ncbi:MAG: 2-phospho-L-lactate transferase [Chloroflexota bacterium]
MAEAPQVLALAGGVGGSKLAQGLHQHLAGNLTVIINTGDDATMWGLRICPDMDTVRYTLAGLAHAEHGWGLTGDTFQALDALARYELDTWFRVGDQDLATSLARTHFLRQGLRLTEVEARLSRGCGVQAQLLPMCDAPVATKVRTLDGELDFQDYFVRRGHRDPVLSVAFSGIQAATISAEALAALERAELVLLCPSNPVVSIGPILAVPGLRARLARAGRQRIAVSPIVGGQAVSGPAGQMMQALGFETSVLGLARMYGDILTGMIVDTADAAQQPVLEARGLRVLVTNTLMPNASERGRLAQEILAWAMTA